MKRKRIRKVLAEMMDWELKKAGTRYAEAWEPDKNEHDAIMCAKKLCNDSPIELSIKCVGEYWKVIARHERFIADAVYKPFAHALSEATAIAYLQWKADKEEEK